MTLAQVRSKTERIREFSALPFLVLAGVSLAGAFFRSSPQAVTGGPLVAGRRVFVQAADRTTSAWDGQSGRRLWAQHRAGKMDESQFSLQFEDLLEQQYAWLLDKGIPDVEAAIAVHAAVLVLSTPGLRGEAADRGIPLEVVEFRAVEPRQDLLNSHGASECSIGRINQDCNKHPQKRGARLVGIRGLEHQKSSYGSGSRVGVHREQVEAVVAFKPRNAILLHWLAERSTGRPGMSNAEIQRLFAPLSQRRERPARHPRSTEPALFLRRRQADQRTHGD
jgi:hypothetical protein